VLEDEPVEDVLGDLSVGRVELPDGLELERCQPLFSRLEEPGSLYRPPLLPRPNSLLGARPDTMSGLVLDEHGFDHFLNDPALVGVQTRKRPEL